MSMVVALVGFGIGGMSVANATTIQFDPGPSSVITSHVGDGFDDLDGIALQGQKLSLDFTCTSGEFIRLFTVTDSAFVTLLKLQTDGGDDIGFLQGSGYLEDQQGRAICSPLDLGSASGNGVLAGGLFPLLSGAAGRPIDFFGIHFDLQLPSDRSVLITSGELDLNAAGVSLHDRFGVGPGVPSDIVPENSASFMLLALGLGALLAMKRWSHATR